MGLNIAQIIPLRMGCHMSKILIKILIFLQSICVLLILPSPIIFVIIKLFTTYSVMTYLKIVIGLVACSIGLTYTAKIIDEMDD